MTVAELITELEKVKDKNLRVLYFNEGGREYTSPATVGVEWLKVDFKKTAVVVLT
jgi:hypothetical protein